MIELINYITGMLSNIWDFIKFILNLPFIFIDWINSFPTFIKTSFYILISLITIIIAIKLISLVKELIL